MFHFPSFPPHCLCVQQRVTAHDDCRVSPFGNPRIKAWLTAPRGLSWPPTSFIGSWCQGIHRAPLKTWPQRCSRPLCNSQTTHSTHPTNPTNSRIGKTGLPTHKLATRQPCPENPTTCRHPHSHDPTPQLSPPPHTHTTRCTRVPVVLTQSRAHAGPRD